MHKVRKVIAGAGGIMISAAIALFLLHLTPWAEKHSPTVLRWIIGLVVGAACCFLIWVFTKEADTPKEAQQPFVAPTAIPAITVQVNPIFNNSPTISQTASPVQSIDTQPVLPEKVVAGSPNCLQVEKPEFLFLHQTRIAFVQALPGTVGRATLGAIAWVHNPAAEEGEAGSLIRSAVASLTYRGENRTLASVPSAYWLNESAYKVDIRIGARCGILLGTLPGGLDGPLWLAAENPRATPFRPQKAGMTMYIARPGWSELILSRLKEIEVSIIADGVTRKKFSVFIEARGPGKRDLTLERTT